MGENCNGHLALKRLQNRHIGQNLKLHPTNTVVGIWKEEMKPWEGKEPWLFPS